MKANNTVQQTVSNIKYLISTTIRWDRTQKTYFLTNYSKKHTIITKGQSIRWLNIFNDKNKFANQRNKSNTTKRQQLSKKHVIYVNTVYQKVPINYSKLVNYTLQQLTQEIISIAHRAFQQNRIDKTKDTTNKHKQQTTRQVKNQNIALAPSNTQLLRCMIMNLNGELKGNI